MEAITNWYTSLDGTMQFYWTVAILTSVVFLIQMILTFVGISDADSDLDFDGDGDVDFGEGDTLDTGGAVQLFSFRNAINFLLGIGWGGVCLSSVIPNRTWLAVAALACGLFMVAAFVFMFKQILKLQHNGAFDIKEAVGQVCDVYLRIPAERGGQGKVQVSLSGSVQEFAAVTDGSALPTGAKVRVVEVLGSQTLRVEKL